MLFRLSVPGTDEHGGPNPVPGFGGQLQQRAIPGVQAEGNVGISYTQVDVTLGDGTVVHLQKPNYSITNPYTALPAQTMISPRTAPPVFGLGLLEAIPESDIISHLDAGDANGDGITGTANYVWDAVNNKMSLGRFGWKSNQPNLRQQTAGAYNGDMGITSPLFTVKSCHGQPQANGFEYDHTDIDEATLAAATMYVQTLGVPARRNLADPKVIQGKKIFSEANCTGCHTTTMKTGSFSVAALSNQTIHPYTDLLLHDMGEGLSDGRPDFQASATQWRTAPLWGIGLTRLVNGHTLFLHDARARDLVEAILWHGGEAQKSQEYFKNLSKSDRDALIAFLNSL
jgi:CxxC motif-containing protein (DUF1111 family)